MTTAIPLPPAATLPWSDTIPAVAFPPPVQPLAMTIVDEEGRRCVQVRQAGGDTHGVCVDEPEVLAVSTTSPDTDGTVYVLGLSASPNASYAVATAGDALVRIELRTVDEWPERVFAAPLTFAAETIEIFDSTDRAIAQRTL